MIEWMGGLLWLASGFVAIHPARPPAAIRYAQASAQDFVQSTQALTVKIQQLDQSPAALSAVRAALVRCRISYKKFSFLLDGCFPSQAKLYNGPAKFEVEEPFEEFEPPQGLQQLETWLFRPRPFDEKDSLLQELTVIRESAQALPALLATARPTDAQLISSMQAEIVRILCLYLAGYDAPSLKSGIDESCAALEGMRAVWPLVSSYRNRGDIPLQGLFAAAIHYLQGHRDFNAFDRLYFIRQYGLPMDRALEKLPGLGQDTSDLLIRFIFPRPPVSASFSARQLIRLGQRLFKEPRLSGNQQRSCASCHVPALYFTDGLIRNRSVDQRKVLLRNTPTLLYAALQSSQFWDGRAASLDAQLHSVLSSPTEMNACDTVVLAKLNGDRSYRRQFGAAFQQPAVTTITMRQLSEALIAYIRTLEPANSRFDQYLRGKDQALTMQEKDGFNLFMGKAHCGTCHFFPVFNGNTPPTFARSEFEVLGVPKSADFDHPVLDTDAGRFGFFPTPLYRGAFKTPTVRNSARTPPYMHNGALPTLPSVVRFYNAGGGLGLGLPIEDQTLPSDSLHLTPKEQGALILFLASLTDSMPTAPNKTQTIAKKRYRYGQYL